MKVHLSHSKDELAALTGEKDHDFDVARAACDEILLLIDSQRSTIRDFNQLKSIVTRSGAGQIRDALSAIEHLAASLDDLFNSHSKGRLANVFASASFKADEIAETARKDAAGLLRHTRR